MLSHANQFGEIQSKSVNATIMLHFGSQDNHKVIL